MESADIETSPVPAVVNKKSEIPGVISGNTILLNPGHTEELIQKLPSIKDFLRLDKLKSPNTDAASIVSSIKPDQLIEFLNQNQKPHAITEVFGLLAEELKQVIDPQKLLAYFQEDSEEVDKMESGKKPASEMKESHNKKDTSQENLIEGLAVYPGQILAFRQFFSNPQMTSLIETYNKKFGNDVRISEKGIPTSLTNREYLVRTLQDIKIGMDSITHSIKKVVVNPPPTISGISFTPAAMALAQN